jgi:hypothetical protein
MRSVMLEVFSMRPSITAPAATHRSAKTVRSHATIRGRHTYVSVGRRMIRRTGEEGGHERFRELNLAVN